MDTPAGRRPWSFDEHYEIYRKDTGSDRLENLTGVLGYDAEGSWSPDGKWILGEVQADTFDIWAVPADGSV